MSICCPSSNDATAKRKRDCQPGPKNKRPKIPVANCEPHVATLHPHVLETHAGGDVTETIAAFARGCRNFGVCVLSASGPIAAAVLWDASPSRSTLTVQGSFNLLSFTTTFLPRCAQGSLAVTLAGPQGQVLGGVLAGPVVAAGMVIVVAATFASSAFDRLERFGAVNDTSTASMLPVVRGEEECGKSSTTEKSESEKSDRDLWKKRLEEIDQCLFNGDEALEEKTGMDGGGEEVDENWLENYLKELEQCIKVPPTDVGRDPTDVVGRVEEKTEGLHRDSGGQSEGNCFHGEQDHNLHLQMVVDDKFGGSRDGCGEQFITFNSFWLSDACLSIY